MSDEAILCRAFEVKDITEDFDPLAPPSTGLEYLQHVMYEASKCPAVVVAEIDRSKLRNHVNVNLHEENNCVAASELAPSIEWQQQQVAAFSAVRQRVARCRMSNIFKPVPLPKAKHEEKWHEIFFGEGDLRVPPLLSVLLSMNEQLLGHVLEYHIEWLEDGLQPDQGRWIYAILACLNLPLTPVTCSAMRDLARQCARLRSTKISKDDPDVIALNLLICLVGKYFGQADLAD